MKGDSYRNTEVGSTFENYVPKVSVIVPVYNVAEFLVTCVRSITAQTLEEIEIILVDDGSTDGSAELCDSLSLTDKRIRVIHKANEGLGLARNSGLEVAMGKYVTFVDSDDYIAPNTLDFAYSLAIDHMADEVRYCFCRVPNDRDLNVVPLNQKSAHLTEASSSEEKLNPLLRNIAPLLVPVSRCAFSTGSVCTAIYRRSVIEDNKLRFLSERQYVSEDYIFNIEFAYKCEKIIFTDAALYFYRMNVNSLTKRCDENKVIKSISFADKLGGLLDSFGYPNARIYAMGYVVGILRTYYRTLFYSDKPLELQKCLFRKVHETEYLQTIRKQYPLKKLPILQRIIYVLGFNNKFYSCRTLFFIRDKNLSWIMPKILFRSDSDRHK